MRAHRERITRAACALAFVAASCARPGEPGAGGVAQGGGARESNDRRGRVLEVGNPSRGADEQPDYDGMAKALRSRIASRLPDPLPATGPACSAMLDAAKAAYGRSEFDASDAVARLAVTHDADLAACERATSASAAACVAIVLEDEGGEWPWVLDQCMRAFPKG
jgi:hypothetical protein